MQLWHLMRGLYDVIPSHLISVFDYQVRSRFLVCGAGDLRRAFFTRSCLMMTDSKSRHDMRPQNTPEKETPFSWCRGPRDMFDGALHMMAPGTTESKGTPGMPRRLGAHHPQTSIITKFKGSSFHSAGIFQCGRISPRFSRDTFGAGRAVKGIISTSTWDYTGSYTNATF